MLKMFSVYDVKSESFSKPFYALTKGEAIRIFTEAANDTSSNIGKYPEDFSLFDLGSFDESNASIAPNLAPVSIGTALEFVKTSS